MITGTGTHTINVVVKLISDSSTDTSTGDILPILSTSTEHPENCTSTDFAVRTVDCSVFEANTVPLLISDVKSELLEEKLYSVGSPAWDDIDSESEFSLPDHPEIALIDLTILDEEDNCDDSVESTLKNFDEAPFECTDCVDSLDFWYCSKYYWYWY